MKKKRAILITGSSGELGTAIIEHLSASHEDQLIAFDLQPAPRAIKTDLHLKWVQGDIRNHELLYSVFDEYQITEIFHFAALLSSATERDPFLAEQVNIEASSMLLRLCYEHGRAHQSSVRFFFPSSIAVYGSSDRQELQRAVKEGECLTPLTLYGSQKRYIELFGDYLSRKCAREFIDFRCLRFPGLISITTLPTGGTSDYGAEMLHAAHRNEAYECFVSPECRLPFMTMPDAVRALCKLRAAPAESLTTSIYNVCGFSASASELRKETLRYYPKAEVAFAPVQWREDIVNSWPDDIDDTLARRDWRWEPQFAFEEAFRDYFIPGLAQL